MSAEAASARTPRRWTNAELAQMKLRLALGDTLVQIAVRLGRSRREVDLALWTGLGRTPAATLEALNRGLPHAPQTRSAFKRFLAELFPA